jgi:two-component system, cell cycle response regulator DivK
LSTILVIDDSRFLRRANELSLARAGHQILSAADGEEGLRLACEKIPDVIVLDMMLPKMGGPQVLESLKKDPRTSAIPVIVLSSLSQTNEAKLKQQGAAAYLEKSKLGLENSSNALAAAVSNVLSQPTKS